MWSEHNWHRIFLVYKTKNFADFHVLRKVAKSLIYKGYYFEVTTKKTMNFSEKVIVLHFHVSKLSLNDHKKDPKKIHFSGSFLRETDASICCYLHLPYVFEKRIVISVKTW